jgi:hypothetical protein
VVFGTKINSFGGVQGKGVNDGSSYNVGGTIWEFILFFFQNY